MNIYCVEFKFYVDYDCFAGAVVYAENEDEALENSPELGGYYNENSKETCSVKLLAENVKFEETFDKCILASYNAG